MDFSSTLKNPWVWGIGVLLGVLVLASRGTGQSTGEGWNPNTVLGLNQIQATQAAAGMSYSASMASIAAGRARDNEAANLARDIKVIDAVQATNGVWSTLQGQIIESAAGVTKNRIQAATSLALDRQQNEVRREAIWVAADTSKFATQLAANVENAKTKAAAKAQDQANQINGDIASQGQTFDLVKFLAGAAANILPLFFL